LKEIEVVASSLYCLPKDSNLTLFGDWDTKEAQVLLLVFEKCDKSKRKTCKSDAEITNFLKTQHLVFGRQQKRFNFDGFRQKTFSSYTALAWHTVDVLQPKMIDYGL
jgi:hypothetical protein